MATKSLSTEQKFSELVSFDIAHHQIIQRLCKWETLANGNYNKSNKFSLGSTTRILQEGLKFPYMMLDFVQQEQKKQVKFAMSELRSLVIDIPKTANRYVVEAYDSANYSGKGGIILYSERNGARTTLIKQWCTDKDIVEDLSKLYSQGFYEAVDNLSQVLAIHSNNLYELRRLIGYETNTGLIWDDEIRGFYDWRSVFDYYNRVIYGYQVKPIIPEHKSYFLRQGVLQEQGKLICLDNAKNFELQFRSIPREPSALLALELVNRAISNTITFIRRNR